VAIDAVKRADLVRYGDLDCQSSRKFCTPTNTMAEDSRGEEPADVVHSLLSISFARSSCGISHVAPGMWLKARDTLHRICDLAEEEGVVFTLENLNLREHPGCPFNSTADVLSLVAAVDRPHLRINLDIYHTQIGEGDVIRHAAACIPWIGEIQVADNPGRFETGTGEMNWPMIAHALDEMGYSGPVGMEAYAKSSPEEALEAFRQAFTL
jgi:hydroxypyruvate isomerase